MAAKHVPAESVRSDSQNPSEPSTSKPIQGGKNGGDVTLDDLGTDDDLSPWRRFAGLFWDSYVSEPRERGYVQKLDMYLLYVQNVFSKLTRYLILLKAHMSCSVISSNTSIRQTTVSDSRHSSVRDVPDISRQCIRQWDAERCRSLPCNCLSVVDLK